MDNAICVEKAVAFATVKLRSPVLRERHDQMELPHDPQNICHRSPKQPRSACLQNVRLVVERLLHELATRTIRRCLGIVRDCKWSLSDENGIVDE